MKKMRSEVQWAIIDSNGKLADNHRSKKAMVAPSSWTAHKMPGRPFRWGRVRIVEVKE